MCTHERIAQAAVRQDGQVYTGYRHYMILSKIYEETGKSPDGEQGFVTDSGRFVSRTEAARIAYRAGQIKLPKTELTSDDLY